MMNHSEEAAVAVSAYKIAAICKPDWSTDRITKDSTSKHIPGIRSFQSFQYNNDITSAEGTATREIERKRYKAVSPTDRRVSFI
ncbi:MAG: hypothetical protein AB1552_03250 [Nitrospirota bacterium]